MSARLTVQETADFLRTLDGVLILTHVRPDGDTVGCAVALCRALRALGRTAYLLENPTPRGCGHRRAMCRSAWYRWTSRR